MAYMHSIIEECALKSQMNIGIIYACQVAMVLVILSINKLYDSMLPIDIKKDWL